jgi:hypothetical protein
MTDETIANARPEPATDGRPPSRIAVLWVPGLHASANTAIDAIARRLAYALDRRSATASARFTVDERIEEIDRGKAGKVRRASIVRVDGDKEVPAVDLFELDYAPTLLRPHLEATALRRWLEATWVVINGLMLAIGTYRHGRAKSLMEKLQLVVGAFWLVVLVGYVWLLFLALIVAINTLFELDIGAWLGMTTGWWETVSQIVGGLLVLALGASATIPAMRAKLEHAGATTISAFAYLRVGRQRSALTGRLADLVEHVAEAGDTYRRIDIVSNSFGSLIALDTLFPPGAAPEPRLARVKGLVTIGCPFDAVRAIWPGYAKGRQALDGAPAGWLNVYSPIDVFGSNFRDDNDDGPAEMAIVEGSTSPGHRPVNHVFRTGESGDSLSLVDILVLGGFRAHGRYWGDQEEAENTCFNAVVSALFEGDPVLA